MAKKIGRRKARRVNSLNKHYKPPRSMTPEEHDVYYVKGIKNLTQYFRGR